MWSFFSRDPLRDFPYEILEKCSPLVEDTIFTICVGKSKVTGDRVSIFTCELQNKSKFELDIAKNAVKRLKTLRHPNILTYLDSCETDTTVYLATEYVEPLLFHLKNYDEVTARKLYYPWGIMQIFKAVSFLNFDANLRHNNIFSSAIYVNISGEWKLGDFFYVTDMTDPYPNKVMDILNKYDPPEISNKSTEIRSWSSFDSWGLGVLIWEVFNGKMDKKSNLQNTQKIPKNLINVYCKLVGANAEVRPNAKQVLDRCSVKGEFFSNDLVEALLFLEEIQIKNQEQKEHFFNELVPLLDQCPKNLSTNKILPMVVNALEFAEAGVAVLLPLLKIGKLLNDHTYEKFITASIVKLFGSNDRATRCKLLNHITDYIDKIPAETVNQKIFPEVVHAFVDTNAVVREMTLKSIIHLAPKLNYHNLNVEVLKHFARLQSKDDQGGIRANTTVCLVKIARFLYPQLRQKVLISAFLRATTDTFPPARIAGVQGLVACQHYYRLCDINGRIIPALSHLLSDPEKVVRQNVFRAIKGFIEKLEMVSEHPELKEEMENEVNVASGPSKGATWAEWAISALKFSSRPEKSINEDIKSQKESLTTCLETADAGCGAPRNLEPEKTQLPESYSIIEDTCGSSYSAEGWDLEDWSDPLDEDNANLDLQADSSVEQCDIDDFKEPTCLAGNELSRSWGSAQIKPKRIGKHEKTKSRSSGPLKLGTKIS